MRTGDHLTLKVKATSLLNLLPVGSQSDTTLTVNSFNTITSTTSAGSRSPKYTYQIMKPVFNNTKVKAAQLTLAYPASGKSPRATEVVMLYFQAPGTGTYQSVLSGSGTTETTWGDFTY